MPRRYISQINKFGTVVCELREKAGLTQEQLAKLCHVHVRTIGRIEKGEIAIGLETILSLAKVFKCQPSVLFEKIVLKVE